MQKRICPDLQDNLGALKKEVERNGTGKGKGQTLILKAKTNSFLLQN